MCFPFGGGGPLAFRGLAEALPASWTVWGVDPPGHVRTQGEPLVSIEEMVDCYLRVLPDDVLNGSFLLGHSLGGYVAFHMSAELLAMGRPAPGIVIGASQPPDPQRAKNLTLMSDEEMYDWVRSMGALPPSLGEDLLPLFAGAIRSDCIAYEGFDASNVHTGSTPLLAVAGEHDPMAGIEVMQGWCRYARNFQVARVPGEHLFVLQQPEALASRVSRFVEDAGEMGASIRVAGGCE